jgi:hypothetical protein
VADAVDVSHATVGDWANSSPRTIPASATIIESARALTDSGHGYLPVVDNRGRVVGIVARGEFCLRELRKGLLHRRGGIGLQSSGQLSMLTTWLGAKPFCEARDLRTDRVLRRHHGCRGTRPRRCLRPRQLSQAR